MLIPLLPALSRDAVPSTRSKGALLSVPLALVGAAGVGLAAAGAAGGSVLLLVAGAAGCGRRLARLGHLLRRLTLLPAMRLVFLALLPLAVSAQTTEPSVPEPTTACPCAAYGPYPCAAATLVALPDQADALGLTGAQLDDLQPIRDQFLRSVHELLDEIQASQEALHTLDRPFDAAEVFALFYDVARHEAELDDTFRAAEAALLRVLDDRQRERWDALVHDAAALQETTPECSDDLVRGTP